MQPLQNPSNVHVEAPCAVDLLLGRPKFDYSWVGMHPMEFPLTVQAKRKRKKGLERMLVNVRLNSDLTFACISICPMSLQCVLVYCTCFKHLPDLLKASGEPLYTS